MLAKKVRELVSADAQATSQSFQKVPRNAGGGMAGHMFDCVCPACEFTRWRDRERDQSEPEGSK